jgi:hypothetical protein
LMPARLVTSRIPESASALPPTAGTTMTL